MPPPRWPGVSPEVTPVDDETKRKAFALRQQGKSWRTIAEELHYDHAHLAREMGKAMKGDRKHDRLE